MQTVQASAFIAGSNTVDGSDRINAHYQRSIWLKWLHAQQS